MKEFFVEGRELDPQQIECIKKHTHNHLVVAGAGTGKTTTIIGKIKYLLSQGFCRPEEILVLSFTNASATEMRERILRETRQYILKTSRNSVIHASTFHSFGLEIIRKCKISGEVSFPEMISLASRLIFEGKYINPYKVVIVDEYQDISFERYQLLKLLRESKDYDLFCVGDDWQSIYKVAGSEVDLILNFEKYFGETEISKIETTYRFPQSIVDVSGWFVMENPRQIRKKMKGRKDDSFKVMEILSGSAREALNFAVLKFVELPENTSILFLGRYSWDVNQVKACKYLKVETTSTISDDGSEDFEHKIVCPARPDLKLDFMTVHKSKGLQADYVFIVNCKAGDKGFPATKEIDKTEKFPFAEERRLFYVALTRAKKKVFLLTVRADISPFIEEIREKYYKKLKILQLGLPETWVDI